LGDFGLAGVSLNQPNPAVFEFRHAIYGTIAYMPPEKLEGRKSSIRGDIYSLGMTLYKMLTGRLFFNDDSLDYSGILRAVRNPFREKPSRYRPEIPPWLDGLVMRMIPAEVHRRPKSTHEIEDILRRNHKLEVQRNAKTDHLLSGPVVPVGLGNTRHSPQYKGPGENPAHQGDAHRR
jgi:serine/threonine-protein kinase